MDYTFYGITVRGLFRKEEYKQQTMFVRIYDPNLDTSGFCGEGVYFEPVTSEWLKENLQDMQDINSPNFGEFVKLLISIKEGFVLPRFNLNWSRIKRSKRAIQSLDGRISLEWSEELDTTSLPIPHLVALFCCMLLVFVGVLKINMITNILNMYFPNVFGIVDICWKIGQYIKVRINGETIVQLEKAFGKEKVRGLMKTIGGFITGKSNKKRLALPPGTKALPPSIAGLLPEARPG